MLSDSNFLPYGRSMLEGARKEFQKLMMMEDAMLIHRIMRAPEKRIFKIDIGNIPPNEVDSFMETIINKIMIQPKESNSVTILFQCIFLVVSNGKPSDIL